MDRPWGAESAAIFSTLWAMLCFSARRWAFSSCKDSRGKKLLCRERSVLRQFFTRRVLRRWLTVERVENPLDLPCVACIISSCFFWWHPDTQGKVWKLAHNLWLSLFICLRAESLAAVLGSVPFKCNSTVTMQTHNSRPIKCVSICTSVLIKFTFVLLTVAFRTPSFNVSVNYFKAREIFCEVKLCFSIVIWRASTAI